MPHLEELFNKLGKQAGLSTADRIELSQKGNNLEAMQSAVSTWMDPGQTSPRFSHFYAEQGEFGILPMELARVGTNTNQTIPNNTITRLTGADAPSPTGLTFNEGLTISATNGSIDLGTFDSPSVFLIVAQVAWDTDASGVRISYLWDADANSSNGSMNRNAAFGFNTGDFSIMWRNAGAGGDNLQIAVYQNSGGDLDIDFWRLRILRVH